MNKFNYDDFDFESIMYAYRDQARLYRRLRNDVKKGVIDHYTVEECTDMMNAANNSAAKFQSFLD